MKKIIIPIITILALIYSSSCSKENHKPDSPSPTKIDTVSFSRNIRPILIQNCSDPNCHSGMDVYENLIAQPKPLVVPKDTSSVFSLYQAVYSKRMPQGKIKLADSSIKQIEAWIMQGALNN